MIFSHTNCKNCDKLGTTINGTCNDCIKKYSNHNTITAPGEKKFDSIFVQISPTAKKYLAKLKIEIDVENKTIKYPLGMDKDLTADIIKCLLKRDNATLRILRMKNGYVWTTK